MPKIIKYNSTLLSADEIYESAEFLAATLQHLKKAEKRSIRRHNSRKSSRDKHGTLKWNTQRHSYTTYSRMCRRERLENDMAFKFSDAIDAMEEAKIYAFEDLCEEKPWVAEGFPEDYFTHESWKQMLKGNFEQDEAFEAEMAIIRAEYEKFCANPNLDDYAFDGIRLNAEIDQCYAEVESDMMVVDPLNDFFWYDFEYENHDVPCFFDSYYDLEHQETFLNEITHTSKTLRISKYALAVINAATLA